jgi:hypothetical protein
MAGPSAHDLGPSGPPSDRLAPYTEQFGVTQSPSQGSQALPGTTEQSGNSTGLFGLLADHPTT